MSESETGGVTNQDILAHSLKEHQAALSEALDRLGEIAEGLSAAAEVMLTALQSGNKILVAGNGGSAAEAQHFAAEIVGRYRRERAPYPALALTADSSTVTAIANDYGYENLFARQVEGLGQAGDVFLAYSTSGESENLVRASRAARDLGMKAIAVTGDRPNRLARSADLALRAPSRETPIIQELHLVITHLLCDLIEPALVAATPTRSDSSPAPAAPGPGEPGTS